MPPSLSHTRSITRGPDQSLAAPQGTIKYEYDEANRRTSMIVPGQEALKYTYNEANLLTELKRGTQSVSFAYNEADMPTTTTLPDSVEEQHGYDEAGELTSIAYKKGATTLGELDYSYDLDSRRLQTPRATVGSAYSDVATPTARASNRAAARSTPGCSSSRSSEAPAASSSPSNGAWRPPTRSTAIPCTPRARSSPARPGHNQAGS
jgi:YD repeat-containing protein